MQPTPVLDVDGHQAGTYQRSVDTPDGAMLLIAREENLGGRPVSSEEEVPDDRLQEAVTAALREAGDQGVNYHLVHVHVNRGTVLLEGYQNDTVGRLAAAEAARVPGVKEIVNMLVIRAL
jgi:osmotically-inducible protein OsmY